MPWFVSTPYVRKRYTCVESEMQVIPRGEESYADRDIKIDWRNKYLAYYETDVLRKNHKPLFAMNKKINEGFEQSGLIQF